MIRLKATVPFFVLTLGACSSSNGTTDGGTTDGGAADGAKADGGATDGAITDAKKDGPQMTDGGNATSVNLGTAGTYAILAKSAVSTVPSSAITGNVGLSPAAASYITGFSLTPDSTNVFSTSTQVTGKLFASDYAVPTPSNLTTAVGDMQLAFTDAAGRAPSVTELGAGDIGGMTLTRGVYAWSSGLLIPTDVTLTGAATDVWIFQIAQGLTMSNGTNIVLAGGALAKNVVWQVSGAVSIGTTSHFEGIVLSQTSITLQTGASINGRLLAQTAVSLDSSTVVAPL
ncbi:MAG TPA: ice-binding family protein [Polyangiaceae bacterium]|nr:ice-binding family protein [Polyangiaceae bacterium]